MQEINERILRIIEHFCAGNKSQFAKMMGEKPQTISSWCTRNTTGRGIVNKILDKLPEISESWLLAGEGDMLKSDADKQKLGNTINANGGIAGAIAGAVGAANGGFLGAVCSAAATNLLPGISSALLKILSQYDEALSAERNIREKGEIENIRIKNENEQLKLEIEELKSKLQ